MQITSASLNALYTGFNTKYQEGLAIGAKEDISAYTMDVPSSTSMETYAWLLLLSSIREWIGPRNVNELDKAAATLVNRDFEHTIGVKRNDIEDDKLGIYAPLFAQMGADAAALWPRLTTQAIEDTGNWIDGASFFAANRAYGKNVINNLVAEALTPESFEAAYSLMAGYSNHAGQKIGLLPTHLVVSSDLRGMGFEILKNSKLIKAVQNKAKSENVAAAVVDNPNAGLADLVVNPRLATGSAYLMHCGAVIKPVAVQKRKEGVLTRWDQETDTCVKDKNRNEYGIHYRGAATLTLPNLIVKIKA